MNITNAAILYDESFVVDHKYKALLQNIPTRHVITAIANDRERTEQITKLRNLDINNYFILGTLDSIKKVLGENKLARVCVHKCPTVYCPNNFVFIVNLSSKKLSSSPACVRCSVSTLSPCCLTCVYISMTTLFISTSQAGDFPKLLVTHNVTFY